MIDIVDDLSGDLIHTVQEATHQILDISTQFLETDVSHAIADFHALYEKNVELDSYKESIGRNIDDMIHYIQDHKANSQEEEELPDLSDLDPASLQASRLTLTNLQKDMEALARLDTAMKAIITSHSFARQRVFETIEPAIVLQNLIMPESWMLS